MSSLDEVTFAEPFRFKAESLESPAFMSDNRLKSAWLVLVGLAICMSGSVLESGVGEEVDVVEEPEKPTVVRVVRRVLFSISAEGHSHGESGDDTVRLPFSARYRLDWVESAGHSEPWPGPVMASQIAGGPTAVWRQFLMANSETTIADRPPVISTLRDSRRTVLFRHLASSDAAGLPERLSPVSAGGLLTEDEFDMVRVPFDPVLLDQIVAWFEAIPEAGTPSRRKIPQAFLPSLVCLDTVELDEPDSTRDQSEDHVGGDSEQSADQGVFVEALADDEGAARRLALRGVVNGAIHGAFSRIGMDGVIVLEPEGSRVASTVIRVRETRESGVTAPGFESDATVVVSCRRPLTTHVDRTVSDAVDTLDAAMESMRQDDSSDSRREWNDPAGRYRVRFDPRWRVVSAGRSLRMRLVDEGALVAEATITPLTAAGPMTLEALRDDVRSAVGDRFVGLDSSDELMLSDGRRVMRVVVAAQTGSRRFRESHHVIERLAEGERTASETRLAVAVITDGSLLSRLPDADRDLVEGVTLQGGDPVDHGPIPSEP